MANDQIVSTLLKIALDTQAKQSAVSGLKDLRAQVTGLESDVADLNAELPSIADVIGSGSDKAAESVRSLRDAYTEVKQAAEDAAQSGSQAGRSLSSLGIVSGRALRGIGLGAAGEAATQIGDIGRLGEVVGDIKNLVSSIAPLQAVAESLAPALGATAASFVSLGLAIAPIAAAVLGVVTVLNLLKQSSEEAAKQEQARIDAEQHQLDQNFQIKQEAQAKTREQLAQDHDNLQAEFDLVRQKLDLAKARKAQIDKEYADLGSSFNPQARSDLGAQGEARQKEIDDLTKQFATLQDQLVTTDAAMTSTIQDEKELADTRLKSAQQTITQMQQQQQLQVQYDTLKATGSSKQVQGTIEANNRQIASLNAFQKAAADYAATLKVGTEEHTLAAQAAQSYFDQITELQNQNQQLTDSVLPVIQAREKETAALEYQKKQLQETADAVKKYNADVETLNGKLDDSRQKLVDTLDAIFENAQKAAEQALQKLEQRRADLLQNASRDEEKQERANAQKRIDILINEQRQEADTYKAYRRKLRDIQQQADEQSFDLILNRDFAGLFNLNRQTQFQKNQAAQEEQDAIADERAARQQNLDDLARSIAIERQERQIALAQQLNDAVTAYQQERQQIEIQRRDAEIKARAAAAREQQLLQQQLDTRAAAIRSELTLIQQGEEQRLAITAQAMQALVNQAQQLLSAFSGGSGGGGGGSHHRAFGGFLRAGQISTVNELPGQRESFGGQRLSGGLGLLIPFRSGNVSPGNTGGSGLNVTITQNIQGGADADLIAEISAKKIVQVLKGLT